MRTLLLLLQLGWRNLWRHARRNLLLAVAIAIGVSMLLLAAALLRGWQRDLQADTVRAAGGHLLMQQPGYRDDPQAAHAFAPPTGLDGRLRALGATADAIAWTQRVVVPAVIMSEREARGVQLHGVDPGHEMLHGGLQSARVAGASLQSADDALILLGAELARRLQTRPGKRVVLTVTDASGVSRELGMVVAGTFDAEGTAHELAAAYTGRGALQPRIGLHDRITEIAFTVTDDASLPALQALLQASYPMYRAATWDQLQPQGAAMIELTDASIWIWFGVLGIALSFGVANTLVTAVLERTRELGLMLVLGMRRDQILLEVLIESVLVVAVGLLLGLIVGLSAIAWLSDGIDLSRWAAGVEAFSMHARLVPELRLDRKSVV